MIHLYLPGYRFIINLNAIISTISDNPITKTKNKF